MQKNRFKIVISLLAIFFSTFFVHGAVNAEANIPKIYSKAIDTSLLECYKKGGFKTPLTIEEYNKSGNNGYQFLNTKPVVAVPNGYFGESTNMTCHALVTTLLSAQGIAVPSGRLGTTEEKLDLLKNLGYQTDTSESSGKCFSVNYSVTTTTYVVGNALTNTETPVGQTVCVDKIDSMGRIQSKKPTVSGTSETVQFKSINSGVSLDCKNGKIGKGACNNVTYAAGDDTWDSFVEKVKNELLANNPSGGWTISNPGGGSTQYSYRINDANPITVTSSGDQTGAITLDTSNRDSLKEGTSFLTGYGVASNPVYTAGEQFALYQNYLKKYYNADIICDATPDQVTILTGSQRNYQETKIYENGQFKTCYVKALANPSKSVHGLTDGKFSAAEISPACSFSCVADWLRQANVTVRDIPTDQIDALSYHAYGESVSAEEAAAQEDYCKQAELNGMGWMLCPALENVQYTATTLDASIQNWLTVDVNFYGRNTPTYYVWSALRNIANILLVIVLIVIVFSQLTGFGIDNYGIKKMLPRLIIMAIVLNLSFYICDALIDLSNIAGVGLRNLFGALGNNISSDLSADQLENFLGTISTSLLAVAAGGAASASTITTVVLLAPAGAAAAGLIVIILILALVVILIAIMMFFLALGARMLLIILCVTLVPVVCVLYILPNTQSLAKKWWKVFEICLIMYPICGAVGGISYMLRAMVLTTEGWHMAMLIVAMVAPYLPFFFLPEMIKQAINGLGVVGGALTSMGNTFRANLNRGASAVQSAVQGSDRFKATAQEAKMQSLRRRVGVGQNGELTEEGKRRLERARERGGAVLRQYAANLATVQKDDSTREQSSAALYNIAARTEIGSSELGYTDANGDFHDVTFEKGFDEHTREAYYATQFLTAAEAGNVEGMNAAIIAAKNSGMKDKEIASMIRQSENGGHIKLDTEAKRAWKQDMAAKYGSGFLATDAELRHWMATGSTATLGNYGSYAESNMGLDDFNKEDVMRLSGDSLAAMISQGFVTQGMAQQILAENPNLSEDKKIMVGMAASGTGIRNYNTMTRKTEAVPATDIKARAEALMSNHSAGKSYGITPEMVQSWVQPPQQRVFITQDESGGYLKQDQPVNVRMADNTNSNTTTSTRTTTPNNQTSSGNTDTNTDNPQPRTSNSSGAFRPPATRTFTPPAPQSAPQPSSQQTNPDGSFDVPHDDRPPQPRRQDGSENQ